MAKCFKYNQTYNAYFLGKELDGIIKLIILILRRCFARPTLPVRTASSIFSHGVLSPAETESSTDNSEDDMIDTESSESDRTTITEAGQSFKI